MKKIIVSTFILQFLFSLGAWAQTRDCDPVVVKGVNLPCMLQEEPKAIVAFKRANNAWVQIPVQIDEMVMKDVGAPYGSATCSPSSNIPWQHLFYADPDLPIGKDGNEFFDDDDELVFMAKDVGDQISGGEDCPSGVVESSMCELDILDPLTSTVIGHIYLYIQNGSLDQSAGANYVSYNFNPSHDYNLSDVICLENGISFVSETSSVTTSNYELGYSARWVEDVLRLDGGSGLGADILDRHQAFVYPNICSPANLERNEDTFSASKGPMVTAKDGPIRAIRSVMGANSGTYNQMTILYTECRVDYRLDHRVHSLAGIPPGVGAYDVLDFNPNAGGMQYYNNQNTGGVTVNGIQDAIVTTNPNDWELYSGAQGSIVVSYDYDTDITFDASNYVEAYYDDSGINAMHTCTGDGLAIGSAGFHFATNTCTDRRHNDCLSSPDKYFVLHRNQYLLDPNLSTTEAIKYNDFIHNPLEISSVEITPLCLCSNGVQDPGETGIDCGGVCPPCEPSCTDGIQNGTETGIDCGGTCPPCDTCSILLEDFEDFEGGFGDWIDGGSNTSIFNNGGDHVVKIVSNTGSSNITYKIENDYDYIWLEFDYLTVNYTIPFVLEISKNGGPWNTVQSFNPSSTTLTNVLSNDILNISQSDRIRFIGTEAPLTSELYLDNIYIHACAPNGSSMNLRIPNKGINMDSEGFRTSIAPVPTKDELTLTFHDKILGDVEIQMFDLTGLLVYERKESHVLAKQNISIDLNNLQQGTYILKVHNEEEMDQHKVIKLD